jgi:hypothetical protein
MNKTKFNTKEEKEFLKQSYDMVQSGGFSLRSASSWLEANTGITISYEGLRKKFKQIKEVEDERLGEESRELSEG